MPVLCTLLAVAGCATTYPTVSGFDSVNITRQPKAGMRLAVWKITTIRRPGQQPVSSTQLVITDITIVTPDFYECRVTENAVSLPATLRIGKDLSAEVRFDDSAAVTEADRLKVKTVLNQFKEANSRVLDQFSGPWRLGDARSGTFRLPNEFPMPREPDIAFKMSSTLRRVVLFNGRQAAEFTFTGTSQNAFSQYPARFSIVGKTCIDLATGFELRSLWTGQGEWRMQTYNFYREFEGEEAVDLDASRF